MKVFELTVEMLEKATTYMPIGTKSALAKTIAEKCIEQGAIATQNVAGLTYLPLPRLKIENVEMKEILEVNTLLSFYFNIDIDGVGKDAREAYDFYMGGNLYNQLERLKSCKESEKARINAFDILADYKQFKRMVDNEIYNMRQSENDTVLRIMSAMAVVTDAETAKTLLDEVKRVQELLEKKGKEASEKSEIKEVK